MLSYLGGMSQTLASVSVMHMLMFLLAVLHERKCSSCVSEISGRQWPLTAKYCFLFEWSQFQCNISGTMVNHKQFISNCEASVATTGDYTNG